MIASITWGRKRGREGVLGGEIGDGRKRRRKVSIRKHTNGRERRGEERRGRERMYDSNSQKIFYLVPTRLN